MVDSDCSRTTAIIGLLVLSIVGHRRLGPTVTEVLDREIGKFEIWTDTERGGGERVDNGGSLSIL